MAQLGSAQQREPSMEEILASIRRIIEDSDGGRKPEDFREPPRLQAEPARAEHTPAPAQFPAREASADVIEVGTFRGSLQDEVKPTPPPKPISLAEVQAQLAAERSREARPEEAPASASPAPSASSATSSVSEWRLGVPEQANDAVDDDFDVDEVANAVIQDIVASQSAQSDDREVQASADEPSVTEAAKPAIISDHTGRQVAAAFGELSEALAARNRKSLDEMAEEMLRPMLQDWLDNNLPTLVERLVREEIERVARGA